MAERLKTKNHFWGDNSKFARVPHPDGSVGTDIEYFFRAQSRREIKILADHLPDPPVHFIEPEVPKADSNGAKGKRRPMGYQGAESRYIRSKIFRLDQSDMSEDNGKVGVTVEEVF